MKFYFVSYFLGEAVRTMSITATDYTEAYLEAVYSLPEAAMIVEVAEGMNMSYVNG